VTPETSGICLKFSVHIPNNPVHVFKISMHICGWMHVF